MSKGGGSPPPAPNYQQAASANRYNQVTPFGNLNWSMGANGVPTSTISLSPSAEQAIGGNIGLSSQMAGLGNQYFPQLTSAISQPSSVNDIANKAYSAFTSRLDPQWAQNTEQQQSALANQGLVPGGEAYNNSMRVFNQAKNDAYQQANLGAIQTMPQTYQLQYTDPLNTMNAIRSGAQIQTPQFAPQNIDALQAAALQGQYGQGLYNAQIAQQNAMTSGLFGLGGAALLAYGLSDRRLKKNVEKVGRDARGWNVYEFEYLWNNERRWGVMADEVEKIDPSAVGEINGIKYVDYGKLYANLR